LLVPSTHALLKNCSIEDLDIKKEKFDIIHLDMTLYRDRVAAGEQDGEEINGEMEEDTGE